MAFFESVFFNFLFFTFVYIIVEFNIPYERWNGKYWLFLNPLHWIWSELNPSKHQDYAIDGEQGAHFLKQVQLSVEKEFSKTYEVPYEEQTMLWWEEAMRISELVVYPIFWRRFSIDLVAHLLINVAFAWELARAPQLWYMCLFWVMIGFGYIIYKYKNKKDRTNDVSVLPKMFKAYRMSKWFKW